MAPELESRLPVPTEPPPEEGVLRYLGLEGCVRLPIEIDCKRLRAELETVDDAHWANADRDPVVQASVKSFFAIGHPRGPLPLPPEDRPVLAGLPYLRALLREQIPAKPTRAIVARMAAHGLIPIHADTPRFFRGTIRLSIQVIADGAQRLYCDGLWYEMAPGEVWAIDNLRPHAIYNAGATPRTNVLVDYLPSDEMARLLAKGQCGRGRVDEAAKRDIEAMTRERYRKMRWRSYRYELFKLVWRRAR
jgi:hypothetical protein